MNCTSCGANIPLGATACPLCGKPTPYANPGANDPTIAASYNTPAGPSTGYGPQPYGGPIPNPYETTLASQNPYGTPSTNPYSYGAPVQNPYETPPASSNPYGAPVQNPYGAPAQPQYGTPYGGTPPFTSPPPQRRGNRTGLIVGLIILLLVILIGGGVFAYSQVSKNNNQAITSTPAATTAATATLVPTPTQSTNSSPSGVAISPAAASIITNPRMASATDSNFNPTNLTTSFAVNKDIYVTYGLNLQGHTGYAEAKWYGDNRYIFTSKVLTLDKLDYDHGYFAAIYHIVTKGAVELYWCTKANCSDAQLAQVTMFTVS